MHKVKLVAHLTIIGVFLVFMNKNNIYAQNWKNMTPNYSFESILQQRNDTTLKEANDSNLKNGIYVELAGSNIYYSLGYKRIFIIKSHYNFAASIGLATNFYFRKPWFSFGIPISINNRFKFWRFNGIDLGINLGNFMNIWTITNKEKYYTPNTVPNPPLMLLPSVHLGWAFRWKRFTLSPRAYALILWSTRSYSTPSGLQFSPFFGIKGCLKF